MVELIEGIINNRLAPKEPVSFSYGPGLINYIPFDKKYIHKFLMLKDQSLKQGTLKIDDYTVFPDEKNDKTMFFMAINSLVKLNLCFVVLSSEKDNEVKRVQDALITLRELPTETREDKENKINAILNKVDELYPAYVIVDANETDIEFRSFFLQKLEFLAQNLTIIALEEKKEEAVESNPFESSAPVGEDYDYSLGSTTTVSKPAKKTQAEAIITYPKEKSNFGKVLFLTLKENYMSFLSFIVPILGVLAFTLLSPLYAKTNKVILIPFILTIILCFSLYVLMTYKCAVFENNQQKISYMIINSVVCIIGYAAAFGLYFLFFNFDAEIKALGYKNTLGIVASIILFLIIATAPLYVPIIINWIRKLIKK